MKRRRSAPRPRRRGVILIVVVGLMALFALVGVTFVITAEQANRGAQNAAEVERYEDPPETLLQRAFQQVLVGTKNRFSSIGPNSLLEDMYGPGEVAMIPAGGFVAGNSNFSMGVNGVGGMMYITNLPLDDPNTPVVEGLSRLPTVYNGRVITMLTGAAAGKSSRITQYTIESGGVGKLRLLPFPGMTMDGAGAWNAPGAPQVGDRFLINGGPFNGTGAGYRPSPSPGAGTYFTGLLDQPLTTSSGGLITTDGTGNSASPSVLAAYAINARDPDVRRYLESASQEGLLNLDEDYDAADFQNPHLALYVSTPTGNFVAAPSFHRPEVLDMYARYINGGSAASPDALMTSHPYARAVFRKLTPRPLVQDHPGLTSVGNPQIASASGVNAAQAVWDVDNDGDGVSDSIWMDVGMSVQQDAQGRTYKPLVAVLCRDMDGKLNLNAHGQNNDYEASLSGATPQGHLASLTRPNAATPFGPARASSQATQVVLPASSSLSPADVSLTPLFTAASSEFLYLLHGRVTSGVKVAGRYGELQKLPLDFGTVNYVPGDLPGAGISVGAARDDNFPPPAMPTIGSGGAIPNRPNILPAGNYDSRYSYATPIDLDGNGAIAVGFDGQPMFYAYGTPNGTYAESADEAFELNLYSNSAYPDGDAVRQVDAPFTPEDLEAVLRPFDVSGPTASRLNTLIPNALANSYRRSLMTTESWDVPTPSIQCTPEIRWGLYLIYQNSPNFNIEKTVGSPTLLDLVRGKIAAVSALSNSPAFTTTLTLNDVDARVNALIAADVIAPELLLGTRLNINRPFGNGIDDDGDGVIDEADEAGTEPLWGGLAVTDRDGDGYISLRDRYPGARLARHLYFLAMLLTDWNYGEWCIEASLTDAQRRELTVRRIAQWAVNVADSRDVDATMTPFEFDFRPFTDPAGALNLWSVDGDLMTNENAGLPAGSPAERGVVWGCETPHLLISETVAFHDVRVRDLDPPGMTVANGDPDPDQYRIPQGTALIELYCPQRQPHATVNPTTLPPELYNFSGGRAHLDLGKMAPSGTFGEHPVWRLAISKSPYVNGTPEATNANNVSRRRQDAPNASAIQIEQLPVGSTPGLTQEPIGSETFSLLSDATGNPVQIDRIVWFANRDPALAISDPAYEDFRKLIYWNQNTNTALEAGNYAVVGPRRDDDFGGDVTRIGYDGTNDVQRVRLGARFSATAISGFTGAGGVDSPYDAIGTKIHADGPLAVACAWYKPHSVATPGRSLGLLGFNISEPIPDLDVGTGEVTSGSYYNTTNPLTTITGPAPGRASDYTDSDPNADPEDRYNPPLDTPEDSRSGFPLEATGLYVPGPGAGAALGEHEKFKTAFLERLANPNEAYHHVTNPYIVVDYLDMDLHIYNGEDPGWTATASQPNFNFSTRQRGGLATATNYPGDLAAFSSLPDLAGDPRSSHFYFQSNDGLRANGSSATGLPTNFNSNLAHTLGYLNRTLHSNSPDVSPTPWFESTNAFGDATLVGVPVTGFNWLPFPNRPFISPMELLLVPSSSPNRLFRECIPFERNSMSGLPEDLQFYSERRADAAYTRGPFGHLLNFFYSGPMTQSWTPGGGSVPQPFGVNTSLNDPDHAKPNYYRIFEYLHVPSRFSGSEVMLDPRVFYAGSTQQKGTATFPTPSEFAPFSAPFNKLPTYREPGRVNLNSINDLQNTTWLGVTNFSADRLSPGNVAFPDGVEDQLAADGTVTFGAGSRYAATWAEVFRSRYGRPLTSPAASWVAGAPTRFISPFRSFSSNGFVPTGMVDLASGGAASFKGLEPTILRPYRSEGADLGPMNSTSSSDELAEPLFQFASNHSLRPAAATTTTVVDAMNDSDRNPFFRFELMGKLSNVTTPRSNVYAVWVTVGLFEVERAIPPPSSGTTLGVNVPALDDANFSGGVDADDYWTIYPDGYTYKGELGADTGEIKRHRGFWIVDRTIPVGFERGEVHNAMDAVILQRVLE